MDRPMAGSTGPWMEWLGESTDGKIDEWIDGWMGGSTDGWVDRMMNG